MPELEMTVAEILEHWPTCAVVINEWGMACVGCQLSIFETLAGAAEIYGVDAAELLAALWATASESAGSH